ncbi:MAG: DUF4281 domain-containing protein [Leptospiraceae bacterium]|nr:DUF4281 domain-containing protein [Leptospiraceae bacterium]
MIAEQIFSAANALAMAGWLLLVLYFVIGERFALLQRIVEGYWIPLFLSLCYAVVMGLLVSGILPGAEGGFSSIQGVRSLFESDFALLGGWIHYLAFDLFVGSVVGQAARREGISILWMLPVWFLTFMFGPVGYALWRLVKVLTRKKGLEASV